MSDLCVSETSSFYSFINNELKYNTNKVENYVQDIIPRGITQLSTLFINF